MKIGNNLVGMTTNKDYHNIRVFPLGIELFLFDDSFQVCLTIGIIELSFSIKSSGLFKI